tara:strand:- start:287 stop:1258 length:972 start_codon:yes stop_codon:yes gene_type:complete
MFLINSFIYSSAPPVETEFKMTVDTTQPGSASDTFVLPLQNTTNNFTVYWGDGTSETVTSVTSVTHVYASSGTYQISLDGAFSGIRFGGGGDRLKLSSIDNWGTNQWGYMDYAFYNCNNMVGAYTDNPDTSLATGMYAAFRGCSNFNSPLTFDCSNLLNFYQTFFGCSILNSDLTFINTSNLTNVANMFYACSAFNSNVNFDDTSNITTMSSMFRGCVAFNKPLNFDTSSVTDMSSMFRYSSLFNQDISGWNISSLTSATIMLQNTAFSTTNYDLLLVGWQGQTHNNSVPFHAGNAQYSSGAPATARAGLISDSWTITDGGAV